MSNFGKSDSTEGNQASRRRVVYLKAKHKSYFISIINIVKSGSVLTIGENSVYSTIGIQELNAGKYAQIYIYSVLCYSKSFSQVLNFLSTDYDHCSAELLSIVMKL